ncbi:hypothetical protein PV797_15790 [Clostridiaceae bacterium M8S5]|nr:hypothetical protein PV797_15790 [Clostridiaceae bacterium M8S5]
MIEKILECFMTLAVATVFYGFMIYQYLYPEKSFVMGRRWMYKEEPKASEDLIRFYKRSAIVGIVVLTLLLVIVLYIIIRG